MSGNWMQDAIAKLDAEDKGYEKGYEAGKRAAAKEILEEVFLGVRAECIDSDSGGYFFYGPFMNLMLDLKKKYGVN